MNVDCVTGSVEVSYWRAITSITYQTNIVRKPKVRLRYIFVSTLVSWCNCHSARIFRYRTGEQFLHLDICSSNCY